jgi:hypothetical protein
LNHPNGGFGFRVEEGDGSFAFFPDNELNHPHPGGKTTEEYASFVRGVDCLIHDAEYRVEEYEAFARGWGHSVFEDTVDLALEAGAKSLLMWHLNQERDDDGVKAMVNDAEALVRSRGGDLKVSAAAAGTRFALQ